MQTLWLKCQHASSNGISCSDGAYIHTHTDIHIHSDSINTEGPLFYYYVFTSMHRVSLFWLEVKYTVPKNRKNYPFNRKNL